MKEKVLLVCKETHSWPMHYLARVLKDEGQTVAAFFIMPHEVLLGHPDYKEFVEANPDMEILTTRDMALEYFHNVKAGTISLDWNYLGKIEQEYSHYKPLGIQMLSSQLLSSFYHYRNYYRDLDWDKQLYFMQLYYQRVEELFEQYKPEVIYDVDIAEHGRAVLLEVAHKRGIPYVTLEYTRFKNHYIPTLTHSLEKDTWLVDAFQRKKQELQTCTDISSRSGFKALQAYRSKQHILASGYVPYYQKARFRWMRDSKNLVLCIAHGIKSNLPHFWRYLRHMTTPLFSAPMSKASSYVRRYGRRLATRYLNVFENVDLEQQSYILIPLHLVPESSTFVKAPFYLNEEFIIESVSKSVLPHQRVLLKEHFDMIGERPLWFYKKLSRLPNVTFVNPFMYDDPKAYIMNADGVVTITGTTAFEAAMLGKPSAIFASSAYSILSSVQEIRDITALPDVIRSWSNATVDDIELAAYLEVVMEWGEDLSVADFFKPPSISDPATVQQQVELLHLILQRGKQAFHRFNREPLEANLDRL